MKKRIFAWGVLFLLIFACASCSKDDGASYTITNNCSFRFTGFIHECNDAGESVNIVTRTFSSGEKMYFTASPDAVKIKIYLDDFEDWVQQVFYLKNNKTLDIVVENSTIVGPYEP
ncbi:MAG: hypothetical protein J6K57_04670 [Alistipes sp.]|nr:hypothetical protein [Alistipes sp.]MBQ7952225.1 hypothetical protein [Alistipes sp.]